VFALGVSGGRVQFDGVTPTAFNLNIGTTEKLSLKANAGNDSFSVTGNVAALIGITVDGGAGDDALGGGNGADLLFGNSGHDSLQGGAGNDTYVLGTEASGVDAVIDIAGIDTITSAISRNLTFGAYAEIENLTLVRSSTTTGIGNALANTITGNAAANALNGLAGRDTLIGGAGIDRLTGGAAGDVFVLNAPLNAANRDLITDFSNIPGDNDVFHLENAVMTKVGAAGALAATAFFAGAAAHDGDDRIVYNKVNGALSYDANGNAAGGITLLAIIADKPVLTSADFVVI
jgi:Ca2+-binding RTX toxin-like protein